jgi:hypothetical protein
MSLKEQIKLIIKKLLYMKAEIGWKRSIDKIYRHLKVKDSTVNKNLVIKHQKYWGQLKKKVNPKWFKVYSFITNNHDIHYIPENIYFNIIEEKLNNRTLALAYGDKNFYELFYKNFEIFPDAILRNINGSFYSKDYKLLNLEEESFNEFFNKYEKVLVKPSVDSGGGKKIQLFTKQNERFLNNKNEHLTLGHLIKNFGNNFIIQNYISQSNFLAQFNLSSVNTIRIFTYRSVVSDDVLPLHAVLRIGKKGNYLDDQNFGGVACKINEDSKLNEYATDRMGNKYYEYNNIIFANIKSVPNVQEMKQYAVQFAPQNIHSRLIGFDFTVDIQNNIKLIEINHLWTGINFFQMNASSVFGKYTDEVIEFCKNLKTCCL